MNLRKLLPFLLISLLLLAACSAQETAEPDNASAAEEMAAADSSSDETMDDNSESMSGDEDMDDEEMMDNDPEEMAGEEMMDDDPEEMAGEQMMDDDHQEMADDEAMMDDEGAGMADMPTEETMAADLPAWQLLALTNAASGEEFRLADFQGKTVFVEPMATWCSNCRQQQFAVIEAKNELGDDVVFVGLSLETNLAPEQLNSYAQGNGFDWTYAVMSDDLLAQLADQFGRGITSAPSTPHFLIFPDGSFSELSTGIHSATEIVTEIQAAGS